MAPYLGKLITDKLIFLAGSGDAIEAYGKACIAGTSCEIEHASALIHTLQFGNFYREAVGAKSYLGFTNTRGPANTQIQIPLMDKHDTGRRSHYLTVQFSIYDAPAVDELVVALGAATRGRPHHRIGDRYSDLKALGRDIENPAGVKGQLKVQWRRRRDSNPRDGFPPTPLAGERLRPLGHISKSVSKRLKDC